MAITIIQVILSVAIITLILLQERSSGMSGLLGAEGGSGGYYQARRGMEKIAFYATIALIVIFVGLAIYKLVAHA